MKAFVFAAVTAASLLAQDGQPKVTAVGAVARDILAVTIEHGHPVFPRSAVAALVWGYLAVR